MTERELELRLEAVAAALDAAAPRFDAAGLRPSRTRRARRALVAAMTLTALAGVTVAPAAVSTLARFFDTSQVSELSPIAPDVAPPYLGPPVSEAEASAAVPFGIRTIGALGYPDTFHVRPDIAGGMVSVGYGGRTLLTQWSIAEIGTRVEVASARGSAADITAGSLRATWIAGEARGTFSVIGADGATHRETFAVAEGALLWEDRGVAFLLQGAGSEANAARLAASVRS
jgi:hypothetical protein